MEKKVKDYQLIDIGGGEYRIASYFDTMRDLKNYAVGYRAGKPNCKLIVQKWNNRKGRYSLECALTK
ncbi:MAG: hypothetical protein IJJ69_08570 [Oscillospiraceae bacterium]|nr:hypothetical protein [Oscillospiraceae bacterium]